MKILLIGASGMVGSRVLSEAVRREHHVIAAARDPKTIEAAANVETVALDVNDLETVVRQAERADVVVSAISPRNTGDAIADAEASTRTLIAVAERTGKRLVMVGGASSLHTPDGTSVLDVTPEEILPEATGMRRAYGMLVTADVDFVVLAPGGMIEPGERTGQFRLGERTMVPGADGGMGRISAEDYAIALIDEIEKPSRFRTIFNVGY